MRTQPAPWRQGEINPVDGASIVRVAAGVFKMGSPYGEGEEDEHPSHDVVVTNGYYLYEHPVTNAQWSEFLKTHPERRPRYWGDPKYGQPLQPVVGINIDDIEAYGLWAHARLPTETEWEYAARGPWIGGASRATEYPWGDASPTEALAWFGHRDAAPVPVGGRPGGRSWCGAQDLVGNVAEWTSDAFRRYASKTSASDSTPCRGPEEIVRVVRGGSYRCAAHRLRCSNRMCALSNYRSDYIGFRLVISC